MDKSRGWTYGWDETKRVYLMMLYASITSLTPHKTEKDKRMEAMERFKKVYPEEDWYPSDSCFRRKVNNIWKENGEGKPEPYDDQREMIVHPITVTTPELKSKMEELYGGEGSRVSVNSVAKKENVARSTLQKLVFKDMQCTKWKDITCQNLPTKSAIERRLKACKEFIVKMGWEPNWLENVWFSDEKHFVFEHTSNRRNDGIIARQTPDFELRIITKKAYPKKVTVLTACNLKYGMITVSEWLDNKGNRINVDKYNYVSAMDRIVVEIMKRTGDKFDDQYWMQDGASCHNSGDAMAYIQQVFKDRYIATNPNGEGLFWPPYSCEMNVLDRCIWGILEARVNKHDFKTVFELEAAILEESEIMDKDRDLIRRCVLQFEDVCKAIVANGGKNISLPQFRKDQLKKKRESESENVDLNGSFEMEVSFNETSPMDISFS